MFRMGIYALLLCSQLAAPALSGGFLCLARNGCVCVDAGPDTCTCCKVRATPQVHCTCGCQEGATPTEICKRSEDCSHIAIGDYETSNTNQPTIADAFIARPLKIEPIVLSNAASSTVRRVEDSILSAALVIIATVVLRI